MAQSLTANAHCKFHVLSALPSCNNVRKAAESHRRGRVSIRVLQYKFNRRVLTTRSPALSWVCSDVP